MFVERIEHLNFYKTHSPSQRKKALLTQADAPLVGYKHAIDRPGLTVVVLTLNKPELIIPLLKSLRKQQQAFDKVGAAFRVVIGDTGSTDAEVLAFYASFPEFKDGRYILETKLKYHFSRCNNQLAYAHTDTDTVLFLNNDVVLQREATALFDMYQFLKTHPEAGAVGCAMSFADNTIQHMGVDFLRHRELLGIGYHLRSRQPFTPELWPAVWEVPVVTGACLMTRSQLFADVGGMDEDYAKECQDVALCLSVHRLGYRLFCLNNGYVQHLENATRVLGEEHWEDRQRFMRHWAHYIEANFL